jgi:hypothetical protein
MYERQLLKELEALRTDIANAAKRVLPSAAGPPKPKIVPPLEDYHDHPRSAPVRPTVNGFHPQSQNAPTPSHISYPTGAPTNPNFTPRPPLSADPLAASQIASINKSIPSAPAQLQAPPISAEPLGSATSSNTTTAVAQQQLLAASSTTPAPISPRFYPLPPSVQQTPAPSPPLSAQPPSVGSSTPRSPLHEPPLGSFGDGSKSMFVKPSATSHPHIHQPSGLSASTSILHGAPQQPYDPLRSGVAPRTTASPLHQDPLNTGPAGFRQHQSGPGFDPLVQVQSRPMSQSMRVQSTRPRLDAREAASKLANMF